jgi:predicted Zn finger-like uncharacterized protein
VTIEVQCTSCHTRYRIDEQVLPEGTPTFKCSRCGHVFTLEPRGDARAPEGAEPVAPPPGPPRPPRPRRQPRAGAEPTVGEQAIPGQQSGWVVDSAPAEETPLAEQPVRASQTANAPTPAAPSATTPAASSAPTPAKPSTDELLSKPFHQDVSDTGENLKFDFNDKELEQEAPAAEEFADDRHSSEWQVGDTDAETPLAGEGERSRPSFASAAKPKVAVGSEAKANRLAMRAPKLPKAPPEDEEFLDEDAAPIYNRSAVTHSARFFVAMLALIAIAYGAVTVLIRSAPATAAEMLSHLPKIGDRFITPIAPARLVAMRDVHADYLQTKGGHTVLVVTGIAENVGGHSLHAVQIAANLRDAAQHSIASRAVYCGNNLSATMVAQMTPHELEFFQKLDPPKTFSLDPSATSPFVIVFVDPPSVVNGFDVSVATASAGTPAPVEASGG